MVISKVEKQLLRSDNSSSTGTYDLLQVPAADSRGRMLAGHLNIYYDPGITRVSNAESILISGSGDANSALKKCPKKQSRWTHIKDLDSRQYD